jgi:hypothetical protein
MSIFDHFNHIELSPSQECAIEKIESFLYSPEEVFILNGYAGSGKTTILKGLVDYLESIEKDYMIMAPTGRAAKVIKEKTGKEAFTIHKSIYSYEEMIDIEEGNSFFYYYKLRNNTDVAGKIFIVDESSMISDAKSQGEFFQFGTGHLLTDLFTYTRVNVPSVDSKIIFLGDPCQLPPVGDSSSKALDPVYLREKFGVTTMEAELKEVKRQDEESGILKAATRMRKSISSGFFNDFNLRSNKTDILNPAYDEFLNTWKKIESSKIIIASKNKTCLDLNLQIRQRLFGNADLPVQSGDILIIGGNNYRKGIFNGEFAVVNVISAVNIVRTVNLRGKGSVTLSWRDIELIFPDSGNDNKVVTGKMLENFLYGDNFLKPEETQALYVDFVIRHKELKPKTEEFKQAIIKDDYFNCILLKFGYAVTCHKAQGGEWDNVFTIWDHENQEGFNCFTDKQQRRAKDNEAFFRWAYTAVTRSSKKLFALNPPFFNSYSSITIVQDTAVGSLKSLAGADLNPEEIVLDKELLNGMTHHNLINQPVQLQDHYIRVRHTVRKRYIEVVGWEKKNLEICYHFKRESHFAVLKTWINKDFVFNGKYLTIPTQTNNEEFSQEIDSLLKNMPNVHVIRNTAETVLSRLEFEFELEEKFPFTRNLFDDLCLLLKNTGIEIFNVEHQQYKERYTFIQAQESIVLDFEYKHNGFFGRVVPVMKLSRDKYLLREILSHISNLKIPENVI